MFEGFIVKGRTVVFLSAWPLLAACSGDGDGTKDPSGDGDGDTSEPILCEDNEDCSDNMFCNGEERCNPDHEEADSLGCIVAAGEPCSEGTCSESADECGCEEPDADGDGHDSVMCGGDDCDDDDANRFPGNTEVCDDDHHDEDCDAETFGFRDQDDDDDPDDQCCNEDESGDLICGTDCNDNDGNQHTFNTEVCDEVDNDCNGLVDESPEGDEDDGLKRVFTVDLDLDSFGSAADDADTAFACSAPEGYVLSNTDCDDSESEVHPAAVDSCNDDVDNDCNETVNDPPGGCDCEGSESESCGLPQDEGGLGLAGQCASGTRNCNDGTWDDCPLLPGAESEVCDGFNVDEDCDGAVDELPGEMMPDFGLRTACYVDQDNDGFAATTSGSQLLCACGSQWTSTEPTGAANTDCADGAANRYPGNSEQCNGIDNDCNSVPDNDATDRATYYADVDGDGFGNPNSTVLACTLPEDYSASGNDCNDSTATIATIATCSPSPAANTTYLCDAGACNVTACPNNFGDCNDQFTDHCETNLTNTRQYCGDCGTSCQIACANSNCDDFVQVAAGQAHTCALTAELGRVLCWGDNAYDQVGSDTSGVDIDEPTAVPSISGASSVAAGSYHNCAVVGGNAICWGRNDYNQSSAGSTAAPAAPSTILEYPSFIALANVAAVAGGRYFTCALKTTGGVSCWGRNDRGQLGVGIDPATLPTANAAQAVVIGASPIASAIGISTGWEHACAIVGATAQSTEGQVYCWGSDNVGQLGDDATHSGTCSNCVESAQPVVDSMGNTLDDAVAVAAGRYSTCAIRQSGAVVCWGANSQGQLGNDSTTPTDYFVPTSTLTSATALTAYNSQACALQGGEVYCWGENLNGTLGDGTNDSTPSTHDTCASDCAQTPVLASTSGGATSVAMGNSHACAIASDGTVCWGTNSNAQLGEGSTSPHYLPALVSPEP